jgi:phytoene dehydrogenase-like protein
MYFHRALILAAGFAASALSTDVLDPESYAPQDVISRDIAVIGGGSTGVYSAVRLRDHGKSVVVIEREAQLGGHAQTFTDPISGTTFNIGVVVFDNIPLVTNYFKRFNVELVNQSSARPPTTYGASIAASHALH